MMRVVRELPPKDSWRIRVNFESRYGICFACESLDIDHVTCDHAQYTLLSVRALMTMPRADKDLLIFLASSRV